MVKRFEQLFAFFRGKEICVLFERGKLKVGVFLRFFFLMFKDILHFLFDSRRRNSVLLVVRFLNFAAVARFGNGFFHRLAHAVGVHDDASVRITCGAPDNLNEARYGAQKTDFIRVEDCDKRHFRQVNSFAEQVDADKHVRFSRPQLL